jgi:hypothetical protein
VPGNVDPAPADDRLGGVQQDAGLAADEPHRYPVAVYPHGDLRIAVCSAQCSYLRPQGANRGCSRRSSTQPAPRTGRLSRMRRAPLTCAPPSTLRQGPRPAGAGAGALPSAGKATAAVSTRRR